MGPDAVDEIVSQWNRERPDLDVTGMGIIGRIGRLDQVLRARLNEVFAAHDLENWEFDVLATLRRSGEPYQLTPGRLLDSMMITSGAMTNRIDRLEARGLVTRSKSPTDGRQVLVTLTMQGRTTLDAALADHVENERRLISSLDPDQQQDLIALLRRLHHGVTRDTAETEPVDGRDGRDGRDTAG
ncbi:MAG: MarR family transcriptional regulator [Actinomycetota bacterium]